MAQSPDPEIEFRQEDEGQIEIGQGDKYVEENEVSHDSSDEIYNNEDGGDIMGYEARETARGPRNSRTSSIFSIKPEPFSGTEDWEEYISHFEICAELGHWKESEKVLALAASLRGPARTFYISLSSEEKRSYTALVRQLGQRFGSTRQQSRWLSRLESRKRLTGEPIAALADDLRQMSQRAYVNLDSRAQEALALNQLYKCISLEMKCRCIDRECQTVAQAVEIIERYEAIMGDQGRKSTVRGVFSHCDPERNLNNQQTEIDRTLEKSIRLLTERLERLENTRFSRQGQNQSSNRNTGNKTCFICSAPDHFFRNCPVYKKCQAQPSINSQSHGSKPRIENARAQGNLKPSPL